MNSSECIKTRRPKSVHGRRGPDPPSLSLRLLHADNKKKVTNLAFNPTGTKQQQQQPRLVFDTATIATTMR